MENGVVNYNLFHVECKKFGELGFTNNEVLLSYFKPPKFIIVLIHVYDNAIVFGPCDLAANGIPTS